MVRIHALLPVVGAERGFERWARRLVRKAGGPGEARVERYVRRYLAHPREPGDVALVNWAIETGAAFRLGE
ncbi:MAG: hypothetical protein K6U14_00285 [Firmicutes bacterium]|nr:hypothetical protein [Alicyclobacillaceae bacterium]MCL6496058.1 hypothetical protein [Bacillota bacterium]